MKKLLNSWIPKALAIALVLTAVGIQSQTVFAASVTSLSDNMSRLRASTLSDHDIRFVTPTGVGQTTDTITLTFSADFTMGTFALLNADFAVSADGTCTTFGTEKTLAAAAGVGTWGIAQASQVITLTPPTDAGASEIVAGRCVQIQLGANATAGGAGATQITSGAIDDDDTVIIGGSFGDTGTLSVDIIADDQVVVTANVDPSITFAISDTTIGYGTLSASDDRFATGDTLGNSAETVGHTLAAGTNATSGYVMYVLGATLTSGANTINAIGGTATATTLGTEQFGLKLVASGGTGAPIAPYNTANYAYNATASTQDDIASASGATATTTYNTTYVGNIASNTEAGAYNATLIYTATATF